MARTWGGRRAQQLRARMALAITSAASAGRPLPCVRCDEPVLPGQDWDLDHLLQLAAGGLAWDPANHGPAHSACNRADGARLGNHRRTATYTRTRRWT